MGVSIRIKQVMTGILALTGLDAGLWATAWPRQFYDSFPGFGRHWVAVLGPYNEHLVRDVGGLYLAMAIVSAWTCARPRAETFAMVGLGWLGFNIPHCVYHMNHLDMYDGIDQAGNVIALFGLIAAAALLLVPGPAEERPRPVIAERRYELCASPWPAAPAGPASW
jgi:hypothetical protein